jgi:hypothetical protein
MNIRTLAIGFVASLTIMLVLATFGAFAATPLGAAFTYHGRLKQAGVPLNASADFLDTFESYTSTAQVVAAGAWGDFAATPAAGTALVNSGGHPGKYVHHPGGATLKHGILPVSASATHSIVWEFDFLVEPGGTPSTRRITGGLRVEGSVVILEMGIFTMNLNPESGTTVTGYAIRTNSIGGAPNNWVCFPGNPAVQLGWHHFRATVKPTQILFELDFQADGVYDTSRLIITNDTSGIAWNSLRIGGPSDLSSPSGGAGFDNVSVRLVPACPADIAPAAGGDGVVNVSDLLAVINSWGNCPAPPASCPADIVPPGGNGVVNVSDLLAIINGWGACP